MRDTLLDLYEQQVLDNLVRTKLKYPIVQIDYSNLTGTLSQAASGNVGGAETRVHNTSGTVVGTFLRRVATSVFNYSVGASQTAQLAMTGQPVVATDSVYKAYVDAIARDEDLVKKATGPLAAGTYHLAHKFNDEVWYVPIEKKAAFFKVYLDTTVLRQTKVPVVLEVKTAILFTARIDPVTGSPNNYYVELVLRDKIPNDSGQIVIPVNGVARAFRYQPVREKDGDLVTPIGQPTDHIAILYAETGDALPVKEFVKVIAGKEVTVKNDTFVAGYVPPLRNQLEELRSQQELQRLQQFGR
jgi:hypothetical protein